MERKFSHKMWMEFYTKHRLWFFRKSLPSFLEQHLIDTTQWKHFLHLFRNSFLLVLERCLQAKDENQSWKSSTRTFCDLFAFPFLVFFETKSFPLRGYVGKEHKCGHFCCLTSASIYDFNCFNIWFIVYRLSTFNYYLNIYKKQ